jgi:hypothetical protein
MVTGADHIRAAVARHPVLWFVVLAYGLAWVCWLPLLADRQDWVRWSADQRRGPPRVFRTVAKRLCYAASCRFRYSSWTSFGVL